MAIQACTECGKEMSNRAENCPHCGAAREKGWYEREFSFGKMLILLLIIFGFWGYFNGDDAPSRPPEVSDEVCQQDLTCWGDRHLVRATIECEPAIERLAKWQARWVDGALEPKFSRYGWSDKSKKFIRYGGDKLQLQNGFGAWQNHIYTCDYDPFSRAVLAVDAIPGKL
jgi:hypothetical protein